jgi:hypothetical protein
VSERDIAVAIAASPSEERSIDTIHCRLRHVDLPKLADLGLLVWDRRDATVRPTGRALDLEGWGIEEAGRWNTAGRAGSSERRYTVRRLLESQDGVKDRDALAYEVAVCEEGGAISGDTVGAIEIALHHVHLPKLDDEGLLRYDVIDGTITACE